MAKEGKLNIVLAGNANTGKSVIFNYLTGLHQHLGNWPGKTVEKAEGTLCYKGYTIDVLDLPGIYSLATYSMEELVSREYIASQKSDFVVNVVDGTNLERNLIFTLQLLELERPTVLALNMVNLFKKKRIDINIEKLEEILKIPVVPVAAIYGKGITKILDRGIALIESKRVGNQSNLKYGKEVEEQIEKLISMMSNLELSYSKRWLAIKLLEKDKEVEKLVRNKAPAILEKAKELISYIEKIHGHDSSIVVAGERCHLVSDIIQSVLRITKLSKTSFTEKLNSITSHKIWGYPVLILVLFLMFGFIFKFGDWFSSYFIKIFPNVQLWYENFLGNSVLASLIWAGIESVLGLIMIAIPYIIPFYFVLYFLEDCGYLARIAFLMDNLMHKLGVHGKACIPLLLGYGCNVPACLSCRIMETKRERFLTGFLSTLIPCSAITVVILGLVGKFVGIKWALALYLFNILIIFIIGKLASKILPGEPTGLIMEMPDYRKLHFRTIFLQTWFRLKDFLFIAGPLVIISGIIIKGLYLVGWLAVIANFLSPVTVKWLGLPVLTGILLIFGILRKELILVMLATLLGTANFALALSPVQMITLALITMFYIPCVATIAVLRREFGWKRALGITIFKIFLAILLCGIAFRL
ncbi:MAG: ferrous iron transport protein B, partial [Patescibacteria group bacterium]|nr:ferrous iron transport protein B [Patescibacteria group bacterium]